MKAVVLLSGGLDSAITAALAKSKGRQLIALSFDYGQRHALELKFALVQARRLGLKRHVILKLPLSAIASGALVDGSGINKQGVKKGVRPSTYVSFRNGVFLALALSLAEAEGATEIWGGWCGADFGGYPDCRQDFFKAVEKTARLGTWAGRRGKGIKIVAPLAKLGKAASLKLGLKLGVDFSKTWTCYAPVKGRPCRACDACRVRSQGFKDARIHDI
jgi:7-cyano-7-deazaguanine synthase